MTPEAHHHINEADRAFEQLLLAEFERETFEAKIRFYPRLWMWGLPLLPIMPLMAVFGAERSMLWAAGLITAALLFVLMGIWDGMSLKVMVSGGKVRYPRGDHLYPLSKLIGSQPGLTVDTIMRNLRSSYANHMREQDREAKKKVSEENRKLKAAFEAKALLGAREAYLKELVDRNEASLEVSRDS